MIESQYQANPSPDSAAYVRFYKYVSESGEHDFVEIIFPGDSRTEMRRRVQESDKVRWPGHWRAYQDGEQSKASGHPLEQWASVDQAVVRDLNHKHIYTVEQLASVIDSNLSNLGLGARELVAKAKAFVDVSKDAAEAQKYAAKYEEVKAANDFLAKQNQDLSDRLRTLEDQLSNKQPIKK